MAIGVNVMQNPRLKQQLKEWQNRSPFRLWRKAQHLSMRDASAILGVSLYTIQAWENGASFPNPENMSLLVQQTSDIDLREKWRIWWKDGPEGKGSNLVTREGDHRFEGERR